MSHLPGKHGERAIVIGASIAGLLAARVLSEAFERVIIMERDELPNEVVGRKGVPQGHHLHALLAAGAKQLDALFPGLFTSIELRGGICLDMSAQSNWFHFGTWKRRFDCGVPVRFQSRLLLEHEVRQRVLALENVTVKRSRATGVRWGEPCELLTADGRHAFDLLVDASGRGTRMPHWLSEAGYAAPEEESVEVNVTYTSARFAPKVERDWTALLIYPTPPEGRCAGGILPVEGGEVIVSQFGWCGQQANADDVGFLEFAKTLPQPEIAEFLQHAERTGEFYTYQYKRAVRRHYERLDRFPPKTCVIGDALCSVDPVFGQGMTLSALSAGLLCSLAKESQSAETLATAFRKRVPAVVDAAWQLSTGEDFRYPEIAGKRPPGTGLVHWYTRGVQRLTATDDDVYRRFARVMNLLDPPKTLFHPSVVAKVMLASLWPVRPVLERPRRNTSG